MSSASFEGPTRYVRDARSHFDRLRQAAERYPTTVSAESGLGWMRRKPYDATAGHPNFFNSLYAAMNAIGAMRLPQGALVVEVGSGPGWLTELLVGLGHRVVAIEPSQAMNDLAAERLAGFCATTGIASPDITFITATLEEAPLDAFEAQADGVMFHEALHHVIDEHAALSRVHAILKPGGCVAICGEGRWNPGDAGLERQLDEEMRRYGTLESPFTQAYLRHVLDAVGFTGIAFHHSVNGLFEESHGDKTIQQVAHPSSQGANTVIAWRPLRDEQRILPSAIDAPAETQGAIEIIRAEWRPAALSVQARIRNTGATYWPVHKPLAASGVTLALFQQGTALPPPESPIRHPMPGIVFPGEEIVIDCLFPAPGLDPASCGLQLIIEDVCWLPAIRPRPLTSIIVWRHRTTPIPSPRLSRTRPWAPPSASASTTMSASSPRPPPALRAMAWPPRSPRSAPVPCRPASPANTD